MTSALKLEVRKLKTHTSHVLKTETITIFKVYHETYRVSGILYIARRHPTKLSEAYPSPYICRYALRRRQDLDLDFMDISAIESILYLYCHIVYLVCIMDSGH